MRNSRPQDSSPAIIQGTADQWRIWVNSHIASWLENYHEGLLSPVMSEVIGELREEWRAYVAKTVARMLTEEAVTLRNYMRDQITIHVASLRNDIEAVVRAQVKSDNLDDHFVELPEFLRKRA